jgi:hypothetical protein
MRRKMVAGEERKRLNIERIREIKEATGIPLTLHGGSGTADADLRMAIRAGINIVHINTELRLAWRRGLEDGLHQREVAARDERPESVSFEINVERVLKGAAPGSIHVAQEWRRGILYFPLTRRSRFPFEASAFCALGLAPSLKLFLSGLDRGCS